MVRDKFSALWLSYSSINDYLKCPRAYYLNNIYRDPRTFRKITIMQPSLALGQAVHETLDELAKLPQNKRFEIPLKIRFENKWQRVSGLKGGFQSHDDELNFKDRGLSMIERIDNNRQPLLQKAIRLRDEIPNIWLSDDEDIILCGKIDWLQYNEYSDSLNILDFKTGKFDEDSGSLQLPIYYILVSAIQSRKVDRIYYWYLDRDDSPLEVQLPDINKSKEDILEIGKRIYLARKIERFVCKSKNGCPACLPYEAVVNGKAKYIGNDSRNQDVYVLRKE